MTFTYDPASPDDVTRVRYHIGDTDSDAAMFTDEEINFVIDEEGSYQNAVISLLEATLARLNREPDMSADWLRVDWRRSADHWRKLLGDKRRRFGKTVRMSTSSVHLYRVDSLQTDPPDYAVDDDD